MRHDGDGYPRWLVEALVFGEYECPGKPSCPTDCGQRHDAEDWEWNHLRARIEHHGQIESRGMALVMDLERALLALFTRHPQAAVIVQAFQMFQPDTDDDGQSHVLNEIFGYRSNPYRQINKSIAWLSAYLSGAPVWAPKGTYSCESAWRSAR